MKTAIIFYSYSGKTRALAEQKACEDNAELFEIKEQKQRSTIGAYVLGSLSAMMQKKAVIEKVSFDLLPFDRILVAVPLWAGYPAPAFHNILDLIPAGKEIEIIITSGSGNSDGSKEKILALAASKGLQVVQYQNIKTV